jgi:hypothetical protein
MLLLTDLFQINQRNCRKILTNQFFLCAWKNWGIRADSAKFNGFASD